MATPRLRLVIDNRHPPNPCGCRTWGLLRPISRDFILFSLMQWAKLLHGVQLKLLARGEHVAVCELRAAQRGQGRARHVMTKLCSWADCARVTLELTPSRHWGSDVVRLTRFYASLGFEPNREQPTPFRVQESMIRYPVRGRGHVRSDLPTHHQAKENFMHVTEMLVTGYDGNEPVFAVNLVPGEANIVLIDKSDEAVTSAQQHATDTFNEVRDLIEEIVGAPVPASS